MTNCKQIPLPKIDNIDLTRLDFFFKLGNHLFSTRYSHESWKSFDLLSDGKPSPMMKHFPYIEEWMKLCVRHTGIKKFKTVYLSVLLSKNQIPWHVDMTDTESFSPAAITSLSTDESFIAFEGDKKYTYKTGHSYLIKSGNRHRIFNLSNKNRYTLCTVPEENPYV